MKLETFFEKFEMFADTPNAIPAMRELVLTLAVQGKLVAQDPEDEPAGELCAQLQKLTSGAKQKTNSISEIELPFEIPACWKLTHLDTVTKVFSGNAFQSVDFQKELGIRVIKITNVGVRDFKETHEFLPVGFEQRFSTFLVQDGDILMALTRPYILDGLKVARCPKSYNGALLNQRVGAIQTAKTNDISDFIYLYLCSEFVLEYVIEKSKTLNQPNLNIPDLRCLPLPLPPLAEQKRIVAKVDELMTLCDRLEAQQQEREEKHKALSRASLARFADAPTPANLQFIFHPSYTIAPADVRKSILTLAVQGKLVAQDPDDEPVEILFERIQTERAEQEAKGTYKSSRPLEPIEDTEEPFELPVEWKWARLRSLVFTLGDGLHGTPEYSDGTDCYFINGNNLVDGRIVIKSHTKTVSLDEANKHRKPMTLSTVLVSINGTLGSVAFYNNENVILGKSACYFNLASLVDKHFSRRVIESPYFVDYATANATGTTIRNLGLKAMNYFPFPLPPLAEQRRIVAKVDELMKLVDALETQLAASRATATNLLAAIVAELTGTPNTDKVSVPASTNTGTGTGRRGRPPKS